MSYKFPSIYDFPPFFTKQIHQQTLDTQKSHWSRLILEYCQFNKIWILSLNGEPMDSAPEHQDSDDDNDDDDDDTDIPQYSLFTNSKIDRSLRSDFILEIYTDMISKGKAEWSNTVLTLYELRKGDLARTQEFYGMSPTVLVKVLSVLVKSGRAQIMKDDNSKIAGVKFSDK
ncbi:hypothetical protein OGAPHI_004146 [Ogataea philodendri]|uniref:Vacuolar protein-sorting-associated protein 25 n=1 Tax=Ogataea philodendri TaxID=1378263 RepID=A0A9P8P648_9ASCO|nr:uncharacterized protein OGAPHI_004146 [Ogataea philodendri]KAH3665957.1 hypothetical protein OGAPHI_004146 [Ogataea philodendri]